VAVADVVGADVVVADVVAADTINIRINTAINIIINIRADVLGKNTAVALLSSLILNSP
jgi:hypothetical protein